MVVEEEVEEVGGTTRSATRSAEAATAESLERILRQGACVTSTLLWRSLHCFRALLPRCLCCLKTH